MRTKKLMAAVMLLLMVFSYAQVTGVVSDNVGPVPDAEVKVEETGVSTFTNENGEFSVAGKVGNHLVITNPITLNVKTITVNKLDVGTINLESEINLEVVVAFGKQKKENLTGAVSVIDGDALAQRPVQNAVQALQGQVAGMNFSIGNGGGELNNAPNFNIRGSGTIGSGSTGSPLVLIDGVEGNLARLNPNDIENISVLKDAASSALYGSRAPFGVILVTTKKGAEGRIIVNYKGDLRFNSPLLQPKMIDSERFAYYMNDAARAAGGNPVFSPETIKKIIAHKNGSLKEETEWIPNTNSWAAYTNGFSNRNWFKEFYRDWTQSQEHNLSVRGGSQKVNFYLSANWLGMEGLLRFNTDTYDRYSFNGKFSAQLKDWLKLDYNARFQRRIFGKPGYDTGLFYHNIARRWPTMPMYDNNGNYVFGNEIEHLLNNRSEDENDELLQQLNLMITPAKNWNIHANLSYKTSYDFNHTYFLPIYSYDSLGNPTPVNYQSNGMGQGESRVYEYAYKANFFSPNIYTDYTKSFGLHNTKFMLGFQSELNKYRTLSAWRKDLLDFNVPTLNTTAGKDMNVSGQFQHWATAGFFGRINYDYDNKYLLELSLRYDGSSRFLRDKRWNWFPAVSAGWNMANEDFWANSDSWLRTINTFKIRGSYGELGNQATNSWYPFFLTMPLGNLNGNWLLNGERTNTAGTPGMVSSLLTWERVRDWNIGLDLGAFNNKLSATFELFKRTTFDMVGPAPQLPGVLGTNPPRINNTDMLSKGFELSLSWNDKIGQDFTYGLRGTLTDNRQKILKYPNELKRINDYYEGRYFGDIWGYVTHGMAKTDEEMKDWLAKVNQNRLGSDWKAGDIMYEDLNGDGEISGGKGILGDTGDRKIIGNNSPRYQFGLNLYANYKGFDVSAFFQGVGKRDLSVDGPYFNGANNNQWQAAAFEQHLDYFRPENTTSPFGPNVDAYFPRVNANGGKNFYTQTRWLQDASYIRLKNLQIGYTLPQQLMDKIGFSKVRIYFSGENLMTWTKLIDIFDPETTGGSWGNGKIYPLSKTISTGISITF
ncbi:Outer membrane cobalamin receptor protein [Candidatus Ornithobacterium hominis]|uniref:SusC/RagA family TonB-linked outer membrane protein n=1 Tax=Candidatus Ornithobacterium hominis TaxID=2497989 RepID=UPI0024BCDF1D|nr:TonB-dependent receptor [Candidatus Ornithobacterium hominis]CAI9430063.1 Outer membrane cobalamin receptor protein [Candidatus Ornithobacterium hominis]